MADKSEQVGLGWRNVCPSSRVRPSKVVFVTRRFQLHLTSTSALHQPNIDYLGTESIGEKILHGFVLSPIDKASTFQFSFLSSAFPVGLSHRPESGERRQIFPQATSFPTSLPCYDQPEASHCATFEFSGLPAGCRASTTVQGYLSLHAAQSQPGLLGNYYFESRPPLRHVEVCPKAQGRGLYRRAVSGYDEGSERRH